MHMALLELEMPSLVDPGEADTGKLKAVTLRYIHEVYIGVGT